MTDLASSATARLDAAARASTRARMVLLTTDQLTLPTVDTGWNVRDLIAHLIGGNQLYSRVLLGREVDWDTRNSWPVTDPLADFDASAAQLQSAIGGVDDPAMRVTTPAGMLPAEFAVAIHATDMLVHGWDLAVATGGDHRLDPALCLAAIGIIEKFPPRVWGNPKFYGRRVETASSAPVDRLVALTGRDPAAAR